MRAFFPLSAAAVTLKRFLLAVVVYIAASALSGFLLSSLTAIPLLGGAVGFISQLIDLYCLGGIVVSVMVFFKVI